MYMLHGNRQSDKLIQEPRQINSALLFRYHDNLITFLGIFLAEFYHQTIVGINRNFHIVQASIAWNNNNPFYLKVHLKHH